MEILSLQSGSNGNCIYVETSDARLLIDAGISGIQAERRLAMHGRDIRSVDAVIISHDHSDHVRCAGVLQRKYGVPVYMTAETHRAAARGCNLGVLEDVHHFAAGESLRFGSLTVETVSTPHDAVDGVVFVVSNGSGRLGVLTDLGHVFDGLDTLIHSLDAVFLESNYDLEMLENGPYPVYLQERIRGPHGHLSNVESAELLRDAAHARLKWACLAHLSEHNNKPALALETHRALARGDYALDAASRYEPTGLFTL